MANVLPFSFEQCFGPLTMLFVAGPLKQDFLGNYLTTLFGVRKFKYTSAISVIFFLKMFKIECKFRKCKKKKGKKKNSEIILRFRDNCI